MDVNLPVYTRKRPGRGRDGKERKKREGRVGHPPRKKFMDKALMHLLEM